MNNKTLTANMLACPFTSIFEEQHEELIESFTKEPIMTQNIIDIVEHDMLNKIDYEVKFSEAIHTLKKLTDELNLLKNQYNNNTSGLVLKLQKPKRKLDHLQNVLDASKK